MFPYADAKSRFNVYPSRSLVELVSLHRVVLLRASNLLASLVVQTTPAGKKKRVRFLYNDLLAIVVLMHESDIDAIYVHLIIVFCIQ